MENEVVLFGWNRPVPGREQAGVEHFQEFLGYLAGLQASGAIASFEPVLLSNHGGDLNGFFLLRGSGEQLSAVVSTEEWIVHNTRAGFHLEGSGAVRGVSGDGVMEWLKLYGAVLERYA